MAPEGNIFILPLYIITILSVLLSLIGKFSSIPVFILMVLLIFLFIFFRDPIRVCPNENNIIISPADGKIIKIEEIQDPDVGEAVMICIFLNVFNVHVNRMPISGKFSMVKHHDGKFLAAFDHKASNENERTEILINSKIGVVKLKQVAGLVARRILCYASSNEKMKMGDRLGFIRFGSRTDLIIPTHVNLSVELGQKVTGNNTIIGKYS